MMKNKYLLTILLFFLLILLAPKIKAQKCADLTGSATCRTYDCVRDFGGRGWTCQNPPSYYTVSGATCVGVPGSCTASIGCPNYYCADGESTCNYSQNTIVVQCQAGGGGGGTTPPTPTPTPNIHNVTVTLKPLLNCNTTIYPNTDIDVSFPDLGQHCYLNDNNRSCTISTSRDFSGQDFTINAVQNGQDNWQFVKWIITDLQNPDTRTTNSIGINLNDAYDNRTLDLYYDRILKINAYATSPDNNGVVPVNLTFPDLDLGNSCWAYNFGSNSVCQKETTTNFSNNNFTVVAPDPADGGNYIFDYWSLDGVNQTDGATQNFNLNCLTGNRSTSAHYRLNNVACSGFPNPAGTGQSVTWTGTGGDGNYSWSGACTGTADTCTTTYSTTGTKTATVTSAGLSRTCSIAVGPTSPLQCSGSPSAPGLNQSVTWTASGGTTYSWSNACTGTGSTCTKSYTSTGVKTATVTSGTQTANCTVNVQDDPSPVLTCVAGNGTLRFNWNVAARGFLQVNTPTYTLNTNNSFAQANTFNTWAYTGKTLTGLQPGATYYAHVSTTGGNPWSEVISCTPTGVQVTPYPTVVIKGNVEQYLPGNHCPVGTNSLVNVSLNPKPAGVTINCGVTPAPGVASSSYKCDVMFDNVNAEPTPSQCFTVSATSADFGSGRAVNNGVCSSASETSPGQDTVCVDVRQAIPCGNANNCLKDILFDIPGWYKLRDADFSLRDLLSDFIPSTVLPFDDDDTPTRVFIGSSANKVAGLVTATQIGLNGANASTKNWQKTESLALNISPDKFVEYIYSRKEYKFAETNLTINNNPLEPNKIYIIKGDVSISNADESKIKDGDVIIADRISLQSDFNVTPDPLKSKSVALVALNGLNINKNVDEIHGIFIANQIDFGAGNKPLKIVGNISSEIAHKNMRSRSDDGQKPSVFMVFEPKYFVDLLSNLSIRTYDWRQLQ